MSEQAQDGVVVVEQKRRSLEAMELGVYFHIGTVPFDPDRDDEPEYKFLRTAYDAIDKKLWDLPGVTILFDYHGNETEVETPESSRQLRVELCELGGENEVVDGRLAYGIHFHSTKEISLDLAQALKTFCEAELKAAAGDVPVSFVKAQAFKVWRETERYDWPAV
jgi:hypothetical protein